jgi:hypothetical protein
LLQKDAPELNSGLAIDSQGMTFDPDKFLAHNERLLERVLVVLSLVLGFFHAWLGRYAMDPDGMSYLDVGRSFFQHDWANAINAWWSPLYPWTLGLFLGIVNPSPRWEFPVGRVFDAGVFVLALLAFRFLLRELIAWGRETHSYSTSNLLPLPKWMMLLFGYPIFLWLALEVDTPWDMTPDLAVLACVCWSAAILLSCARDGKIWRFIILGLALGIGYLTKAILLPVGIVLVVAGYMWRRSSPDWRRGLRVAAIVFFCISMPFIVLLSHQKGRLTFSDTGKVNYAWYVSPRTFWRNWQGAEPGSGTPAHSTRQLLKHPPVFEFDGPVVGTYPPWTDPSYWNEGLQWHFKLGPQLEVLMGTIRSELRLVFRSRPDLVAGVIILVLLCGGIFWAGLCELWPLLVIASVGMGLYLPMVENDRYLGGFVLLIFITLLAAVRLRPDARKSAAYVTLAVCFTMLLATVDYTVRIATHHLAIPGTGPNSTVQDIKAAEQLSLMGVRSGDKVAIIMNGTSAYWAHLAKLRIVAEIMETGGDVAEFWNSPAPVQQQVLDSFVRTGAKIVVTICPAARVMPTDWQQLAGTPYCVHRLE